MSGVQRFAWRGSEDKAHCTRSFPPLPDLEHCRKQTSLAVSRWSVRCAQPLVSICAWTVAEMLRA